MDEQLAAIYGTGQPEMDESDLEKTAAAELLVKLAEEQGVDLNDFSDEEVGEMLDNLYEGGIEHTAEEEVYEEAQEKFAEADYLGRIMAHSMVQELDNIEKEAVAGGAAVKGFAEKAGKFVKGQAKGFKTSGQELAGAFGKGWTPKERLQLAGSAAKRVAPELGTAAGLTAGGIGLSKIKSRKKTASALDILAEQRAFELASEAGYIDEGSYGDQVKEAAALDYEVERRALEICEANGIPVEWNE